MATAHPDGTRFGLPRPLTFKLVVLAAAMAWFAWQIAAASKAVAILEGTPEEFWIQAAGPDFDDPDDRRFGRAYPPRDGWAVYSHLGFHGEKLLRVPLADVDALVATVIARLEAREREGELLPRGRRLLDAARRLGPRADTAGLMAAVLADEAEVCRREGPESFECLQALLAEHRIQWERAERLWVTQSFES